MVINPPDAWEPLDMALSRIDDFHWIIFSSSNGVRAVEERLNKMGKSLSSTTPSLKIAAVGKKTSKTLCDLGSHINFVPPNFVADSLIQHFPASGLGLKILIPRVQTGGRTIMAKAFKEAGSEVIEVAAYESSCPELIPKRTIHGLKNYEVDAMIFTSAKTA